MKRDIIIVDVHSFVDVITNSSTELFVCDTDKSVDMVEALVKEIESAHPNEYGHMLSIEKMETEDWRLQEIFSCYIDNEEDVVKYLRAKGYTINGPAETPESKYISISAERGGMDPRVFDFINKNFNVIHYDTDA